MNERRFAGIWCAQAFLRELVLIYPTAAIMMQAQGISALSLSLLFIIWSASAVLFEVPSGVLADRTSRRNLLVLSGVIEGVAFLIWLLVMTSAAPAPFWGFAFGFVVWSLASALRSGTSEALLHDILAHHGRQSGFERLYGWEQAASSVGVTVALLLGGWVAEGGYVLPLLLSALAPWLAAVLVAAAVREPPRETLAAEEEGYFATLREGLRDIRRGAVVMLVVTMIATLPTVYEVAEEYVPPLLDELGFSLTSVGVIYALALAVRSVSMMMAHRLRRVSLGRLCALFAVGGLALTIGVGRGGPGAVVALCGYFALSGVGGVLLQGRLQRAIAGRARATVTSVAGMSQELVSLVIYLAIGTAAQLTSWQDALMMIGVGLSLSALALGAAVRRRG